jgi:two-component system response regulator NreC
MSCNRAMIVGMCRLYSEAIKRACEASSVPVVAMVSASADVLPLATAQQPDVAFVDIDYVPEGLELVRRLKVIKINVVIITGRLQAFTSLMADRLILLGGLHRADFTDEEVRRCLESVARRQRYFSAAWEQVRQEMPRQMVRLMSLLTEADVDCLRLVGRGYSDAEVAEELGISVRTAEGRRSRIMKKLGLYGTPKLMRFAIDQGFADVGTGGGSGDRLTA